MNIIERGYQLDEARLIISEIADLQNQLDNADTDEGRIKDQLAEAHKEFDDLARIGKRTPRIWELHKIISDLQDQLRNVAHAPLTIENMLRAQRSLIEGYRARDHIWLQAWRIGKEPDMGAAINVESTDRCEAWLVQVRIHVTVFLPTGRGDKYLSDCEGKLSRRRDELAAGRRDNANAAAYEAKLRLELQDERRAREAEVDAADKKLNEMRAELEAKRKKERKAQRRKNKLAFDRRAARRQYGVYLQQELFWGKMERARDDADFRNKWVAKVARVDTKRAARIDQLARRHSSENARRGSESFALLREKWDNIVILLNKNPEMNLNEADDATDDVYQEKRETLSETRQAELDAHNAAQQAEVDAHNAAQAGKSESD